MRSSFRKPQGRRTSTVYPPSARAPLPKPPTYEGVSAPSPPAYSGPGSNGEPLSEQVEGVPNSQCHEAAGDRQNVSHASRLRPAVIVARAGTEASEKDNAVFEDVDDTEDWIALVKGSTPETLKGHTQTQIDSALRLLRCTVSRMFGAPKVSRLHKDQDDFRTRVEFSVACTTSAAGFQWARSTSQKMISIVRKILLHMKFSVYFVRSVKLVTAKTDRNLMLGNKYGTRAPDDRARLLLESWVLCFRAKSKSRSDLSIRNIINFLVSSVLPAFGLTPDSWDENSTAIIESKVDSDMLRTICGKSTSSGKKGRWLNIFLLNIAKITVGICRDDMEVLDEMARQYHEDFHIGDDGTDHHRIAKEDLDKLYVAAQADRLHELVYMIFLTTGMRIGGLCKIKIENIADLKNGKLVVRGTGRTIEKGNKPLSFVINDTVRLLFQGWLDYRRPADPSPYVFPGRHGGHISTSTVRSYFNQMCDRAGVVGDHFHPHAIRHSFAHILLELGNSPVEVAKLLNHVNSGTTEKFYLKENAAEIVGRANVPWLQGVAGAKVVHDPLPECLKTGAHTKTDAKRAEKKKRKRATESAVLQGAIQACKEIRTI